MNSIVTRVVGVAAGCGLMGATPFLGGTLAQSIQPPSVWCTEHYVNMCKVCKDRFANPDTGFYQCGTTMAQQTCPPGYTPVCELGGPYPHYRTRCDAPSSD
ncbi:MAG: hypothetical protein KatS3mg103_0268 [Phycisphaerales bacterium]|nr:MAG: hypothetical protein KatS3mg103_0268 [Phycisphaerales bacterium]